MENNTPPIGEPNATATPAALDAVRISRIFTDSQTLATNHYAREVPAYLDFSRNL